MPWVTLSSKLQGDGCSETDELVLALDGDFFLCAVNVQTLEAFEATTKPSDIVSKRSESFETLFAVAAGFAPKMSGLDYSCRLRKEAGEVVCEIREQKLGAQSTTRVALVRFKAAAM